MKLSVDDLLGSKIYVKENSAVSFKSPRQYLEPFLDLVGNKATDIRVQAADSIINAEESGLRNIAYPRVNVEATVGDEMTGFYSVVGFIYALNIQTPILKVYTGQSVKACMNLTIFQADHVFEQNLLGNFNEVYLRAGKFIQDKQKEIEEYSKIYKDLTETPLTPAQMHEALGSMLMKGANSKLGTTPVVGGAKLLGDPKSAYYTRTGEDFGCNKWNIYNAVTQCITDGADIVSKPTKTVQLAKFVMEE
jgi:hypothetical protein